jgi:hypothetical protein
MTGFPGRCRRGGLLPRWKRALGLLLLWAALVAAACGTQEAGEPRATPSPAPEATATAEAATPSSDIQGVEFSQVPAVQDLESQTGGSVLPQDIIFADLTGDGVDEAVVPISSGGSGGDIAYAVFRYQGGDLEELLAVKAEAGRVTVSVQGGALVDTQPVYGPEDPLCCPSELRHTYYRWDGGKLVVDHETTETVPSAKP